MVMCSVVGCSNRSGRKIAKQLQEETKSRISFHRFPENVEFHQAWIDAIQRANWVPNQFSFVCSAHFAGDCIDASPFYRKLSKTAVPTIFPIEYYCTPLKPIQESGKLLPMNEEASTLKDPIPMEINYPIESIERTNTSEKFATILPIPDTIREFISKTTPSSPHCSFSPATVVKQHKFKFSMYKKKIRSLQQKTRRQDVKIAKFEIVLKELQSRKCITE